MTNDFVVMDNSMHLSKLANKSVVLHTKGVNGVVRISPDEEHHDDIILIMKGANNYREIHPESPDYKYVQGIFCKIKWKMSMGYWRNSRTKTITKMHVIILGASLCNYTPTGDLYLSRKRVIIDYITCTKCIDQYCRTLNKAFSKDKPTKNLKNFPKLRLGI